MSENETTDLEAGRKLIECLMATNTAILNKLAHLESAMAAQTEMLNKLSGVVGLHHGWFERMAGPAAPEKGALN